MTPITLTHFEIGVPLALKGFAAAIVGGLTSPFGAIIGGLILGLVEALAGGYISTTYPGGRGLRHHRGYPDHPSAGSVRQQCCRAGLG